MEQEYFQKINILKHPGRPNAQYYIEKIFRKFIEFKGDRVFGNDNSILGGVALLNGSPVTVIGQLRGNNVEEQVKYNFSMTYPEGFRKTLRLMKQAEKFNRPVICFVDTIGAYPGVQAEERGQASAIANNLKEMMFLKVPIVTVMIGNGGSGGALALSIADKIVVLENAVFSTISPRACAEILWKNSDKEYEAAILLKMTSKELYEQGIIDYIIPELHGGAHNSPEETANYIKLYLGKQIKLLTKYSKRKLVKRRLKKFVNMGK